MGKWASKHKKGISKKAKAYSAPENNDGQTKPLSTKQFSPNPVKFQHSDAVTCVDVCREVCVSGGNDGTMILQNIRKDKLVNRFSGHNREVTKVCLHRGTGNCVSASRDKSIKIWRDSKEQCRLTGHELSVTGVAFDNVLCRIWSGSRDNTVRLWDVESSNCVAISKLSRNLVTDLCYSSEMNLLAQTSEDQTLKLWDPRNVECTFTFPTQNQILTSCSVSDSICVTTNNGFSGQGCEICFWDLRQRRLLHSLKEHTETVSGCKFIGRHLVSCSHDATVKLWSQNSDSKWSVCSNLHPSAGALSSLSVADDNTILICSYDKGVLLINMSHNTLTF